MTCLILQGEIITGSGLVGSRRRIESMSSLANVLGVILLSDSQSQALSHSGLASSCQSGKNSGKTG